MKTNLGGSSTLDAVAEHGDKVEVRVQDRRDSWTLYIDVNGITVCRIGHIVQPVAINHET